MLSQLGCVTLYPEIIQAAYVGTALSEQDQDRYTAHPQAARDLLVNIPRLEPIAWMISQQLVEETPQQVPHGATPADDILFGAQMLKLSVAFDSLKMEGLSDQEAIARLRARSSEYGHKLLDALADMKPETARMELRKVPVSKLAVGMVLYQEVRTKTGTLVVAKNQEVTHALIIKLSNFSRAGTIDKEVMALVSA